jgi:hypothetical protein
MKNPPPDGLAVGYKNAGIKTNPLDRQTPRTSAYRCATTPAYAQCVLMLPCHNWNYRLDNRCGQ